MVTLEDARQRLDILTVSIMGGLAKRMLYPTNLATSLEDFGSTGQTWLNYRLTQDQEVDAKFGRYQFSEQSPIGIDSSNLPNSELYRKDPNGVLLPSAEDNSKEIVQLYRSTIKGITRGGDQSTYGETVKIDSDLILDFNERINGVGRIVAQVKVDQDPKYMNRNSDEILEALTDVDREKKVIQDAVELGSRLNVPSKTVENLFRNLIDLTAQTEVKYIQALQQKSLK